MEEEEEEAAALVVESRVEPPPVAGQSGGRKRGGKTSTMAVGSMAKGRAGQKATSKRKAEAEEAVAGEEKLEDCDGGGPRVVRVSKFDYSVENHLNAMDRISELCGEAVEEGGLDESEIRRFSSSLTFLRQVCHCTALLGDWRVFNYQPRDVKFASEAKKEFAGATNLPQFSSAAVPQEERLNGDATSMEPRDFVMYVGGSVWGLDWCPRVHESPVSTIKREFIAIAAHPPGSSYHKIGAALSGKGLVQIWSLFNVSGNEGEIPPLEKPQRGCKKSAVTEEKPSQVKRPRGRPRKKPLIEHTAKLDGKDQYVEPLGIQVPEDSPDLLCIEGVPGCTQQISVPENHGEKQSRNKVASTCDLTLENTVQRTVKNKAGEGNDSNEHNKSFISSQQILENSGEDPGRSNNVSNDGLLEISSTSGLIPNDVTLPRVVLCLAHNGRVAWDMKWRPCNPYDSKCKHRMGFLAVLLGNGSLEVWEVPHPNTIKVLYSSLNGEGTDPRFVKLEPVFRCSMLKSGGTQSIPLTVEWSTLPPHQFLLAGCHDGTVALWKFSENISSKDTRPLLCFSVGTVPIRAVAWAPVERRERVHEAKQISTLQKVATTVKRLLLFAVLVLAVIAVLHYGYKGLLWLSDWMNEVEYQRHRRRHQRI
ncbi:Guanine nucleotide-binding protein, beta subunit [Parasponia andersonii]|uniref:Guanine nucleotide-binding protein, beta subunit n=1 Tax=Parasponia andersonii TaxID=3476 RepID=A0A2P5E0A3_PARAD|nr:Guanine nucleotide-binding protein, beta subunit [Parasponia andersonii]